MKTIFASILLLIIFLLCSACAPKIYLVDRQSILEQEANGEWPELDKKIENSNVKVGPEPIEQNKEKSEPIVYRTLVPNVGPEK